MIDFKVRSVRREDGRTVVQFAVFRGQVAERDASELERREGHAKRIVRYARSEVLAIRELILGGAADDAAVEAAVRSEIGRLFPHEVIHA